MRSLLQTVLIPMQCEYYAGSLSMPYGWLEQPDQSGGLVTMFDRTGQTSRIGQMGSTIQSSFRTVIPHNVRLSEAPNFGLPVALYAPKYQCEACGVAER